MPLSTVLGAQSLIKPGVCTTATRPASPYTGQMIYDTTVATTLVWNGTAWIGGAGKVLQVVSTTKTDTYTSATTTYTAITGLSVSITPTSSTSKVLIIVNINYAGVVSERAMFRMMRDSTAINIGDAAGSRQRASMGTLDGFTSANIMPMASQFLDSPATTSSVTYTLQMRNTSGANQYINRTNTDTDADYLARTASTITVMEISA